MIITEIWLKEQRKAFSIFGNPNYDGYQRGLASMVYEFFNKKSAGSGVSTLANKSAVKSMSNQQIANELHKTIIRKVKKGLFLVLRQYLGCRFNWYEINKQIQLRN